MYGSLINVKLAADAAAAPSDVWEGPFSRVVVAFNTFTVIKIDPTSSNFSTWCRI
jgi:hypothetical protein